MMNNLREIAAKKLTEQLLGDCEAEYKAMWHNGRLTGNWPNIENEKEWEDYYFFQGEEISDMIRNLQDEIKETWGFDWKIYSYGRMGATFAPDGFSDCGNGHHFNRTLDQGRIVDFDYYEDHEDEQSLAGGWWTEAFGTVKNHLAAFKFINKRVRAGASMDMAQWWEETKEGCELTYGDEDEEGEDQDFDEAVNG